MNRTAIPRRHTVTALAAAAAIVLATVLATVAFGGCGGRASTTTTTGWSGGPVTPVPVVVTVNPSALAAGLTMPTGVVVGGREMILYFWGNHTKYLTPVWREVETGVVFDDLPGSRAVSAASTDASITDLVQLVGPDGTLVEYGVVRGPVGRIVSSDHGVSVEAQFTHWSEDAAVTVFWLRRTGAPIPGNSPSGDRDTVPLAENYYPLLTVYDPAGGVTATVRIRPSGTHQGGG